MSDVPTTWTVNKIKDANRAAGGHWFDPSTMQHFGTKVLPEVYQGPGGVFFITTDKTYDGGRGYTVRSFDPETGDVCTAKDWKGDVTNKRFAVAFASNRAAAGQVGVTATVTAEPFRPVSVLEQFRHDIETHGRKKAATADNASTLITLARKHHKAAERSCNTGRDIPKTLAEHIILVARHVGAVEVILNGDPRGATVKLVWADKATNDFGGEGWIVPTGE